VTVEWLAEPPPLRRPALVAAFEGWNDAADAASDAVRWLARRFGAPECATIPADDYVDFQASRPHVELVDGVVRRVTWPATRVMAATCTSSARDLVLAVGVEPNLRWPTFCAELLDVARRLGCDTVVTLGALLADTPHTRAPRITGSATDDATMQRVGLERSRYEGPTGIVGVLHNAARDAAFAAASLWVPVPHYVATAPNPKATRTLVDGVARLLDLSLDLADLDIAAAAWERSVAQVVESDAEASTYVARLEERYDHSGADEADTALDEDSPLLDVDDLPSGETLAADFERYLRDRGTDDA
jgi:proteasome assembly chaperone (PAC2) family protein